VSLPAPVLVVQRLTTRYWLRPKIFFIGISTATASMLAMRVTYP
jgi:hypothetical protein